MSCFRRRSVWGLLLLGVAGSLFIASFGREPEAALAAVNTHWEELRGFVDRQFALSAVLYFLFYVAFTSLSLPGALFLTVLGGALFGLPWAMGLVSFASTTGAVLACLFSRYLLRDWVVGKYQDRWQQVRQEIDQGGGYYLLALRLNPLIPYFLVNLFFGLTRMPWWRFGLISQLGMLPATFLYTYAGAQLGQIKTLRGLVSGEMLLALAMLSLFPLAVRWIARWIRNRSMEAPVVRPNATESSTGETMH